MYGLKMPKSAHSVRPWHALSFYSNTATRAIYIITYMAPYRHRQLHSNSKIDFGANREGSLSHGLDWVVLAFSSWMRFILSSEI
jgi:hypothetical protein